LANVALSIGAAALFVGCGGSQPPIGAPGAVGYYSNSHEVWRSKGNGSTAGDLLYAFFGNGVTNLVYVLTYPGGSVVNSGSLPNDLFGSCVDGSGNVFVASQGKSDNAIYEFPPGGVTPSETLSDSGRAWDCSVDATTGNLAVANFYDTAAPGGPAPDIAVYGPGQQTPVLYGSTFFEDIQSCAYDDKGNLFIYGLGAGGAPILAELASGSSVITLLGLNVSIGGFASLRWDGEHIAITVVQKRTPTKIYQIALYGSTAEVVGTTTLKSHSYKKEVKWPYGWMTGGDVVESTLGGIGLWRYPSGGKQQKTFKKAGSGFYSVTISVAPSR